mgnify:CR=1 FL=1
MESKQMKVIKSSGEKVAFSLPKLKASLRRSGANEAIVEDVINIVQDELYQDISTKEIYNRAFALLKKKKSITATLRERIAMNGN